MAGGEEAFRARSEAVQPSPDSPEALNNLGQSLWRQGKAEEALAYMHRAVLAKPDYAEAIFNFGTALYAVRRYPQAATAFARLVALLPNSAEAWGNYSTALLSVDQVDEGVNAARRASELRPDVPLAFYNLGVALKRAGRRDEAEDAYRRCIGLNPSFGLAYGNLANCVAELGRIEEAMGLFHKAMSLTDESWVAESYTFLLYFRPGETPESILRENRRWNERYVKPRAIRPHFENVPDPTRRLRIGYVSAYFYSHCQAFFKVPLLANHDHSNVEVYCYSNSTHEDSVTARLKGYADVWRNVAHLDDPSLARLIRDDRIDVLIDCNMHMQNHRLSTFALRAAPVQLCWLAYPGTTGLAEMDYRISDPYLEAPGHEGMATEKTVCLPHSFWCYDPLSTGPAINPLPALARGYITFGCLNNFMKVNDLTLGVWSKVLAALPTSRLILLTEPGRSRQRVAEKLTALGVHPDRVRYVDRMPRDDYLRFFNEFDLSIDTFPTNGHTTTLDSLWMGVPPLTTPGETTIARGGWSMLSNLGLQDLAAKDLDSLPQKALEMTSDLNSLAALRSSLRDRMLRSPLMDGPRFAWDMESAYRQMWTQWCNSDGRSA